MVTFFYPKIIFLYLNYISDFFVAILENLLFRFSYSDFAEERFFCENRFSHF